MNRIGQLFFFTLMLAVVVIILMLALAPIVLEFTSDARNATINGQTTGLDCGNSSISDFDNAACIVTDLTLPYFIGILLAIGGAMIGARLIIGS